MESRPTWHVSIRAVLLPESSVIVGRVSIRAVGYGKPTYLARLHPRRPPARIVGHCRARFHTRRRLWKADLLGTFPSAPSSCPNRRSLWGAFPYAPSAMESRPTWHVSIRAVRPPESSVIVGRVSIRAVGYGKPTYLARFHPRRPPARIVGHCGARFHPRRRLWKADLLGTSPSAPSSCPSRRSL